MRACGRCRPSQGDPDSTPGITSGLALGCGCRPRRARRCAADRAPPGAGAGHRARHRPGARHLVPRPAARRRPGAEPPAGLASPAGEDAVRGVRTELVLVDDRPRRAAGRHRRRLPAPAPAQPPAGRSRARSTWTASSASLPNVVWTSAGPVRGGRLRDRPDPAAGRSAATSTVLRRRQVPADGRLRAADRRPDRRRRPGPARRPPGRGHHRDARGLRQLQRRHPRHLDGRGPDLRRRASSATAPTSAAAPRSWARCPAAASR